MRVTRIVASGDTRFQFLLVFADGFGCSDPVTARLHLLILLDTCTREYDSPPQDGRALR